MTAGERVLAAAHATVGARFRAQGRDPALGLDCVGVVAVALAGAGAGAGLRLPRDYARRSGVLPPGAVPAGMAACDGDAPGDILLCRLSAAQLHLAVRSRAGFIHADAQARRVVERPGPPPWPVEAAWRWTPEGE